MNKAKVTARAYSVSVCGPERKDKILIKSHGYISL